MKVLRENKKTWLICAVEDNRVFINNGISGCSLPDTKENRKFMLDMFESADQGAGTQAR